MLPRICEEHLALKKIVTMAQLALCNSLHRGNLNLRQQGKMGEWHSSKPKFDKALPV